MEGHKRSGRAVTRPATAPCDYPCRSQLPSARSTRVHSRVVAHRAAPRPDRQSRAGSTNHERVGAACLRKPRERSPLHIHTRAHTYMHMHMRTHARHTFYTHARGGGNGSTYSAGRAYGGNTLELVVQDLKVPNRELPNGRVSGRSYPAEKRACKRSRSYLQLPRQRPNDRLVCRLLLDLRISASVRAHP